MRGAWLTRLGEWFLDEETFNLVLSPAIADLQFESAAAGLAVSILGYIGVWKALAGAVWRDTCGDVLLILEDAPMLSWLIALQVAYYAGLLMLLSSVISSHSPGAPSVETALILTILILGLSTASTVLLFWPARRTSRARSK